MPRRGGLRKVSGTPTFGLSRGIQQAARRSPRTVLYRSATAQGRSLAPVLQQRSDEQQRHHGETSAQ